MKVSEQPGMTEYGYIEVVLRFLRSVFLTDASLAVTVGLIGIVRGWRTVEAFGSALIWTGMLVIFIAAFTGAGGLSARAGDVAAYTRSGAGDTAENMLQLAESRSSALGFLLLLLVVGLGLIGAGYLLPLISSFF